MLFTWLNDFASRILHHNLSAVQVFEHELEATQRLHQSDLVVHEQVVAISSECLKIENSLIQFPYCFDDDSQLLWNFKFHLLWTALLLKEPKQNIKTSPKDRGYRFSSSPQLCPFLPGMQT